MTEFLVPTAPHPENPGGVVLTTFLNDARVLTPDLFAVATDKVPTIEVREVEHFGECYHITFPGELTADERTLALLVAQGSPVMDQLLAGAKNAIQTNNSWATNVLPQIVAGANTIANTAGSSTQEKNLAAAVKTLANQVAALARQNDVLIKWSLGLYADGE